jgi:hypothetical protein
LRFLNTVFGFLKIVFEFSSTYLQTVSFAFTTSRLGR